MANDPHDNEADDRAMLRRYEAGGLTMNNDDERDYDEEQYNRHLMDDERDPDEETGAEAARERLEYLRSQLQAERISYGELIELQNLIPYIEPGDVELLEAAGVPEFPDEEDYDTSSLAKEDARNAWQHEDPDEDGWRQRAPRLGTDRNGIIMPGGWSLYYDGELVFSTSKWESIGPGVESIMKDSPS